jgi:hypothetical protein
MRRALMADLAEDRRRLAAEPDLRRIKRKTWLRALAVTAELDDQDRALASGLAQPGRMTAAGELVADVPADLAERLAALDLLTRVGDRWVAAYPRRKRVEPQPADWPLRRGDVSRT